MEKKPASRIVRRRPQAGFTLIEILMAMTIFSTSFLALAAGAGTVMKSNHTSYNSTIATTLAQDKLEELRAQDVAAITNDSDNPKFVGVTFTRNWTRLDNSPVPGVTEIRVIVAWTDQRPHTLTISSAVDNPNL